MKCFLFTQCRKMLFQNTMVAAAVVVIYFYFAIYTSKNFKCLFLYKYFKMNHFRSIQYSVQSCTGFRNLSWKSIKNQKKTTRRLIHVGNCLQNVFKLRKMSYLTFYVSYLQNSMTVEWKKKRISLYESWSLNVILSFFFMAQVKYCGPYWKMWRQENMSMRWVICPDIHVIEIIYFIKQANLESQRRLNKQLLQNYIKVYWTIW